MCVAKASQLDLSQTTHRSACFSLSVATAPLLDLSLSDYTQVSICWSVCSKGFTAGLSQTTHRSAYVGLSVAKVLQLDSLSNCKQVSVSGGLHHVRSKKRTAALFFSTVLVQRGDCCWEVCGGFVI